MMSLQSDMPDDVTVTDAQSFYIDVMARRVRLGEGEGVECVMSV